MPIHQAVILALVQAVTEFLPISSSAHLFLTSWLLGWKDQGLSFDIALHIGTLAAVLVYFLRDWVQIIAQGLGVKYGGDRELGMNRSLLWLLAVGSIPAGLLGLALKDYAETTLRSPYVMGAMLIGVGILMARAERLGRRERSIGQIGWVDAGVIGSAQALALVPGTSRSGITLTAGLLRNIDRHSAARFSFLLSTPITAAATFKGAYDVMKQGGIPADMRAPVMVGIAVSAIAGLLVIGLLLRFLRTNTLRAFVYYRVIFGIIVIALAILRSPAE